MKKKFRILALTVLATMCTFALASCGAPDSDPAKAKGSLEENGYTVTKWDADGNIVESSLIFALKIAGVDDIDCVVTGNKGDESVVIVYFEDADDAKAELDDVQDYAGDLECKRSGKMVYYGTEAGIKAAR